MGEIHVHEFMSLDGVIDAPTWTFDYDFDPKMGETLAALTGSSRRAPSVRLPADAGVRPRLFPEDAPLVDLSLAACEAYENGVVYLAYTPKS